MPADERGPAPPPGPIDSSADVTAKPLARQPTLALRRAAPKCWRRSASDICHQGSDLVKAVLLPGARQVQVTEDPGTHTCPGEVLIASRSSALCRSDMSFV